MTQERPSPLPPAEVAALLSITVLLGYVLFLPVSNNAVLYPVFALIGLLSSAAILRRRARSPRALIAVIVLALALGVIGTTVAVVRANDGLLFAFLVFFASPTLYALCAWGATARSVRWFLRVAAIATIAIALPLLFFVAGEAEIIPQLVPSWWVDLTGLGATFKGGASQARSFNLSSLAALGPLWAASLVVGRDQFLPHWSVRAVCAVAAAGAAFVSSRDAIVLVILVAPIVAIVVGRALRPHPAPSVISPLRAALASAGGALLTVLMIPLLPAIIDFGPVSRALGAVGGFFRGSSTTASAVDNIRTDQAEALLRGWAMNPIIGSGFGARVPDYARTSERPWVLELQYHLLLFNVGLIGVLIVCGIAVCSAVLLRNAARSTPAILPTLTATTTTGIAMLMANATNPYLQAPGHMWALFLPLAVAVVMTQSSDGEGARIDRLEEPPRGSHSSAAPGSPARSRPWETGEDDFSHA